MKFENKKIKKVNEKQCHENFNREKSEFISILIYKVDFKAKKIARDGKTHYIMIRSQSTKKTQQS